MGKLLRVLTVFIFLLSIAALVLGIMLFQKREELKGRTQKLENTLINIAERLIESEESELDQLPQYPERDIDEVTSRLIDSPRLNTFWNTYNHALETLSSDLGKMRIDRGQLMNYYRRDRATGKIERDPTTGFPITEGRGTMQEILDDIREYAARQLTRLDDTREELRKLREEYIQTVRELNQRKQELRQDKNTIVQLNNRIAQLEQTIRDKDREIAQLRDEIRGLNDTIADRDRQILEMQELIAEKDAEIEFLKGRIRQLEGERPATHELDGDIFVGKVEPGVKGSVSTINAEWGFTVLDLTDEFMREIMGELLDGPVPRIDLYVRRPDKADGSVGEFVTKMRLRQIRTEEKLGVADILSNWQQLPVRTGDVVFTQ